MLPVELLKNNPNRFHEVLLSFLDLPLTTPIKNARINESTRLSLILYLWRSTNYFFNIILALLRLFRIETNNEYKKLRYRYYNFKRRGTQFLNRVLQNSRALDFSLIPSYCELYRRYEQSNNKLQQQVDFDLRNLGYPVASYSSSGLDNTSYDREGD